MPKTIHFNTGRSYTVHGQRITATLYEDGMVTFWDHDRAIDGEFELGQHCQFNQVEVMHWYDAGTYGHSLRSFQDGMAMGGLNRVWEGK